ncbi:MAG: 23S rRNA (pseudouridine(1915)-N(3))-methyltransferase RlmH [Thermodesulfobacteriota bacterium]
MRIELLFLGRTREGFYAEGIAEYSRRLARYVPVEIRTVKERRLAGHGAEERRRQEEGRQLLAAVSRPTFLVVLDGRGAAMGSEELARRLGEWTEAGGGRLSFVLGGPSGLADAVLAAAGQVLSLSAMTLPHELARLVLVEQLYRALTIRAGHLYHR